MVLVEGDSIPEAWEKAVLKAWESGVPAYTEYGQWSRDCTMLIVVRNPLSEPGIHLGGLCGGLRDLERYVAEVVEGSQDQLVREGRRPYEYHERLFEYSLPGGLVINQVDLMARKLSVSKRVLLEGKGVGVRGFSRRCQAITWKPWVDAELEHPPCLQRVWCRILDNALVMETSWRSRDAYKAAFWNIFAMVELQRRMAEMVSAKAGEEISVGQYVDFSNSFHIYEQDFKDFEQRFLKLVKERGFQQRTVTRTEYAKLLKSGV